MMATFEHSFGAAGNDGVFLRYCVARGRRGPRHFEIDRDRHLVADCD
jgi:hypothetical protein